MITRRTLRRTHLFRPDQALTSLFVYCLAVFSEYFQMHVHAVVVMSTHEHIVLTDPLGCLPRFLQQYHRVIALAVKVLRAWEGAVWNDEKTSLVELCTPEAVVEKLAYVMTNPVSAGLVERAHLWPGLTTLPSQLGSDTRTASRPNFFFDPNNVKWPHRATLKLVPVPGIGMTVDELREAVLREVDARERAAGGGSRKRARTGSGPRGLAKLSPYTRARSWEPLRSRNPTFAVGRGRSDAFFACVERIRAFREHYREALASWRAGLRSAVFPAGTWLMRVLHGAPVVPSQAHTGLA